MNFSSPDSVTEGFASPAMDRHLAAYAAQTDRLVNSLSAAIAQLTTQTTAQAVQRYNNTTFRSGVALGGMLTGEDPAALMRGISRAIGGSMPSFVSPAGISGAVLNRGNLTDQLSKNVFDHIQRTYFNSMGLSNLTKTYGMSRGQMGEVFSIMGQRGMLAGAIGGNIGQGPGGLLTLNTSAETMGRIDEQFKKTSQVLGAVKKMFGATGSLAELATIAENMTGVTIGPSGINAVLNRLQAINSFSKSLGVNATMGANIIQASVGSVGQFGAGMAGALATGAAGTSALAYRGLQTASNVAEQRGRGYIAPRDIQELQQTETVMRGKLLEENPLLAESLLIAQSTNLSPDKRQKLQSAISAFKNAGTKPEQAAATASIRAAIENVTGAQAGMYTKKLGGVEAVTKALSPDSQKNLSDILGQNLSNRGVNVLADLARSTNIGGQTFGENNPFNALQMGQAGMAILGGLNAQSRDELMMALKSGKITAAENILNSKGDILKSSGLGSGLNVLRGMIRTNGAGTAAFIEEMQRTGLSLDTMKTTVSAEDKRMQESLDARQRVSNIFDTNLIEKPGMISEVIRNTLGQGIIGNEEKMRYLLAQGSGDISKFSLQNFGQTAAEAEKLNSIMSSYGVDLFKELGVDRTQADSYKKLAAAMGTNTDKVYNLMASKGVVGAQTGTDEISLATKTAAQRANKQLDLAQQAQTELILSGDSTEKAGFEDRLKKKMEELSAFDANVSAMTPSQRADDVFQKQKQTAEKFATQYSDSEVLKSALSSPDNTRFKELLQISQKNPDLLEPMFKAAEKQIRGSSGTDESKKERLQQLNELQDRLKEAKGRNMVGVVEIRGDKQFLKLYDKQNA